MFFFSSGGTHSNLVICDHLGQVVGRSRGPGTNHWALGLDECAKRIIDMLHAAKQDAGIPLDTPLACLVSHQLSVGHQLLCVGLGRVCAKRIMSFVNCEILVVFL